MSTANTMQKRSFRTPLMMPLNNHNRMGVGEDRPSEWSLALKDRLASCCSRCRNLFLFAWTSWINEMRSCSILSNANVEDRFDEASYSMEAAVRAKPARLFAKLRICDVFGFRGSASGSQDHPSARTTDTHPPRRVDSTLYSVESSKRRI